MRILITGNAGSGKTTLSKHVAKKLGLKQYGLDKIVWKEGWQKTAPDERSKKIAELVRKKSWVIDGVDFQVMKAADIVVFLDFPRRTCYWRTLKRNPRYFFTSRPDLPPRSPEILIIPYLLKLIWRFPRRVKPKILKEKRLRNPETFVHITSNKELPYWMDKMYNENMIKKFTGF